MYDLPELGGAVKILSRPPGPAWPSSARHASARLKQFMNGTSSSSLDLNEPEPCSPGDLLVLQSFSNTRHKIFDESHVS